MIEGRWPNEVGLKKNVYNGSGYGGFTLTDVKIGSTISITCKYYRNGKLSSTASNSGTLKKNDTLRLWAQPSTYPPGGVREYIFTSKENGHRIECGFGSASGY